MVRTKFGAKTLPNKPIFSATGTDSIRPFRVDVVASNYVAACSLSVPFCRFWFHWTFNFSFLHFSSKCAIKILPILHRRDDGRTDAHACMHARSKSSLAIFIGIVPGASNVDDAYTTYIYRSITSSKVCQRWAFKTLCLLAVSKQWGFGEKMMFEVVAYIFNSSFTNFNIAYMLYNLQQASSELETNFILKPPPPSVCLSVRQWPRTKMTMAINPNSEELESRDGWKSVVVGFGKCLVICFCYAPAKYYAPLCGGIHHILTDWRKGQCIPVLVDNVAYVKIRWSFWATSAVSETIVGWVNQLF